MRRRAGLALLILLGVCVGTSPAALANVTFGEQQYEYEPGDVLPGAVEFERTDTHWIGYGPGEQGERSVLGYVLLTDDLVDIPGYSGHTLNTLVGLDPAGTITGIKIVHHAEPIVLIGLSEKVIHDFVAQYVGKDIRDRIIISDKPRPGHIAVDAISGATVTAVAENATILEAGRRVGRAVGIVRDFEIRTRRVAERFEPATWDALVAQGAIGRLVVEPDQVQSEGSEPILDLRFAVLDAPAIGKNLLGDRYYAIVRERLEKDGGSALFIGAQRVPCRSKAPGLLEAGSSTASPWSRVPVSSSSRMSIRSIFRRSRSKARRSFGRAASSS